MAEIIVTPNMTAAEMAAAYRDEASQQMQEASRKAQLATQKIGDATSLFNLLHRNKLEHDVAENTLQEAEGLRHDRQSALRRQLSGAPLLTVEQEILASSGMKPVGPETGFVARCFNRISNAQRLKQLFEREVVDILARNKSAAEATSKLSLHVTPEQVKKTPKEMWGRTLYNMMRQNL